MLHFMLRGVDMTLLRGLLTLKKDFCLFWHSLCAFLSNFSLNQFRIIPESSVSNFGTNAETLQLRVAFEGEESDQFLTNFGRFCHRPDLGGN